MRIIDASDDKQHFFVRVTDDGRLLYARRAVSPDRDHDHFEMLRSFVAVADL